MPVYDYKCPKCGFIKELYVPNPTVTVKHELCKRVMVRLPSAPSAPRIAPVVTETTSKTDKNVRIRTTKRGDF